jgi:hypothetical protein
MSPRLATQEISLPIRDFSGGIQGGISERGIRNPNWLAAADNYYGRPYRMMRVRPGTRDLSTAILSDPPHSLMGFYSGGGNKLFVAAANKIFEVTSTAYTLQTLPASHPASSDIFGHTNLDGVLVATQRTGALTPLMYDGEWKELKLPEPTDAIGFAADTAIVAPALGVDVGDHYYRIRWRFAKGSSLAGPVSAKHTVAAPNQTVNINAGLTASGRSDYIGWTLERTKVNGTAAGPFWFVKDGTGTTTSDDTADASLGYMADEGIHGEPPHVDGITGFTGRLWGWAGSSLYASQAAGGDLEATGIANFDADLVFPVAKDDGDTIQVGLVVLDELLILKRRSVHVMSGVDPESYVLTSVVYADPARGSEAGCAGPRAACVIGGVAYFWGESGGLFSYSRGQVKPVGWSEMGRYLDEVNPAALDNLLLINHQGNYMLAWYPKGTSTIAQDQVVKDARFKPDQWWHWKGWAARDAIELKSGILGAASLAFCDPANRAAFQFISNGATISGPGVPGGTTVTGAVIAGSTTLTMSANASATAQNVTLTIAGVDTPRCNTVSGSPTVTISEYHCWSAFESFKDEKTSNGAGGKSVPVLFESPWLDYGLPDDWKDLDRVSLSSEGDLAAVNISIQTDPPGGNSSVSLIASGSGADWAPDSGSGTNDLEWDVGDWAAEGPTTGVSGVPAGTLGRRFKIVGTASVSGDHRPSGIEMVATLLPDREYSK